MLTELAVSLTASQLRRAFDRTFREVQHAGATPMDDFLAVRVGVDSYAIRLSEIAGLFADKAVTRLPTSLPALLGAASFRGIILPVYDLAVLLGYAPTASSRWLVTAASGPVAFALSGFERHLRLSRDTSVPQETGSTPFRLHVREVARIADGTRAIVHLPSVIEAIKHALPQKER